MKNFLILGLLALLLFSVSAALSLWLNQSKQPETAEKDKEKEKDKDKDKDKDKTGKGKGEPKESSEPRPPGKADAPAGGSESAALLLRDREIKLERRAAQLDLVVRDLQSQREGTEAALQKVMTELKSVSTETKKLDLLAEELKKKVTEFDPIEKKNTEKIAAIYDAMSPEAAAPIFKQMADSGRLDMAAKILAQMKERKSSAVLEAMNDPMLALQIVERVQKLRGAGGPAPAAGPAPSPSPVVPAKGP